MKFYKKYTILECPSCHKRIICYKDDAAEIINESSCCSKLIEINQEDWTTENKIVIVFNELENRNQHLIAEMLPQMLTMVKESEKENFLKLIVDKFSLDRFD